jgi:hypothetical protein
MTSTPNAGGAAIKLWIILALSALAWGLLALGFASLAPTSTLPQIFHNYHVEHFAAFYVVALLAAAALPTVRLLKLGLIMALLATVLAVLRLFAVVNKIFYLENLICDYCGVLAALVPIGVGKVRAAGRAFLRD